MTRGITKNRAKKFQKLIYFKDTRMQNLATKVAENSTANNKKNKSIDRHYPFNCISKYYPLANSIDRETGKQLMLPCGFEYGVSWGALRKCWIGYKQAKRLGHEEERREYAERIQRLQKQLGIPTASFPDLGMLGDIFFLYDKEKELELRQKYMYENVVCDKMGVSSIDQLLESGDAIMFNSKIELERYQEREHHSYAAEMMAAWSNTPETRELLHTVSRKWDRRAKVQKDLLKINMELASLKYRGLSGPERIRNKVRKDKLNQIKILKEAELDSVQAIELVKTDTGWKYAKRILEDEKKQKQPNYEPVYHLVDLDGRRLTDPAKIEELYKDEEQQYNYNYENDPYFYRLYLEDKEWEKICAKESKICYESTS